MGRIMNTYPSTIESSLRLKMMSMEQICIGHNLSKFTYKVAFFYITPLDNLLWN